MTLKAKEQEARIDEQGKDLVDWWFGTVVLSFLPTILSIIICFFKDKNVDWNKFIGDGELILVGFLITAPSFFSCKGKSQIKPYNVIYYILFFSIITLLVIYVTIKVAQDPDDSVAKTASLFCVCSSILISWISETYLRKRRNG